MQENLVAMETITLVMTSLYKDGGRNLIPKVLSLASREPWLVSASHVTTLLLIRVGLTYVTFLCSAHTELEAIICIPAHDICFGKP